MTYAEIAYLRQLATGIKCANPVIVNIGAADGISTIAFLEARPDAFIFSVDIEPCQQEFDHLRECGQDVTQVVRLLGRSEQVGLHFPYQCDLLFVDGGHFNAANDIDTWLSTVMPGGVIAFHDFIPPEDMQENNPGSVWHDVHAKIDMDTKIGEVDRLIAFRV
jgi:predicted O-methyltransferase YrrM